MARLPITLIAALIAGCASSDAALPSITPLPPTTLLPPIIEAVGIVSTASQVNDVHFLVLDNGRELTVSTPEFRILTMGFGFGLLIVGRDSDGRFAASYPQQGGLPPDCYVENAPGIDRGPFVELRGILWRKAPRFAQAQPVAPNYPYPGATRFCFDLQGAIWRTVWP